MARVMKTKSSPAMRTGTLEGKVEVTDDFDEPLELTPAAKTPLLSLHERIARCLKWKLESVRGFPLVTLRIWVKNDGGHDLAEEIQRFIDRGDHHFDPELHG